MSTTTDEDTITRTHFARLVTLHCRFSGLEPDQGDLDQWLASCWSRVLEDQDPARWARQYQEALAGQLGPAFP